MNHIPTYIWHQEYYFPLYWDHRLDFAVWIHISQSNAGGVTRESIKKNNIEKVDQMLPGRFFVVVKRGKIKY